MSRTKRQRAGGVSRYLTCTNIIVGINVVVFMILTVRGDTGSSEYMYQNGALWVPAVLEGREFYRLVTAVFLHFSVSHLFNNMLLLFFMGDVLETAVGRIRFLIIYFLSGIAGNVITILIETRSGSYSVSAGASGAVFGVLGALLCLLMVNHGRLSYLSGKSLIFYLLYSLFTGATSSGINNAAHVGGLAAGFVLMLLLYLTMRSSTRQRVC